MRHPGTSVTRTPVVPADEAALDEIPDLSGWLGRSGRLVASPARRCSVPGAVIEPRLGPWDLGSWTGRAWHELDVKAWRADASFDGHGGESLTALIARVGALLDEWHTDSGRVAVVTHAAVIKAAVVHALRAPGEAMWNLDIAPASFTELHSTASGWRITRTGCR